MHVVIIDNFDSFTYNLADLAANVCARSVENSISSPKDHQVTVYRNDKISISELCSLHPTHLIISPGPGDHTAGGICHEILTTLSHTIPTLGVCLGHQLIAHVAGATIQRAPKPVHGHQSRIEHTGHQLFQGIPTPFSACRYHSLIVSLENLPSSLTPTAYSEDRLIMGLAHKEYPQYGVQFHPESFLSDHGEILMQNFLKMAQ